MPPGNNTVHRLTGCVRQKMASAPFSDLTAKRTKMTRTFRKFLLATSAVTMIGYAGAASAQTAVIDTTTGLATIAAGVEAMLVQNSQTAVDALSESAATGAITTDVTGEDITADQTNVNSVISTLSRLNQATNTVTGDVTTPSTALTGSTAIDPLATVSIDAGAGIVSFQTNSGAGSATATNTSPEVTTTVTDTGVYTGATTVQSASVVADALMNDVSNSVTITGAAGALATPAAIANLQIAGGTGEASATIVTSALVGADLSGVADMTAGGDVNVLDNAVAARAGVNQATNELVVGNGSAASGLGLTPSLAPVTVSDTAGTIDAFVADYAVANSQVVNTLDGGVTAQIDSFGVGAILGAATTLDQNVNVSGNQVITEASANQAVNRAIVSVDSIEAATVGVVSAQTITATDVLSKIDGASNVIGIGGDLTDLTAAGGVTDGSVLTVANNTVSASGVANKATNILGLTSSGGIAGSTATVVGNQFADTVTVTGEITSASIGVNTNDVAGVEGIANVTGNQVLASAALNSQTNLIVANGGTGYSPASLVASNTQLADASTSTATITLAGISATSGSGNMALTAANNTIKAMASANVATNTVANTSRSFSFGR